MDNEMIERVIKASFDCWAEDKGSSYTVKDLHGSEYEFAVKHAKAVIKAMREPTEPVLMKISEAILACPNASDYERLVAVKAVEAFIDAVINETPL